jgi:GNAT superfamily N-acetyltransferase
MFQKMGVVIDKAIYYYNKHGILQSVKRFFNALGFVTFNRTLIFIILNLKDFPDDVKKPYSFHLATIDDMQNEQDYQAYIQYGFTKKKIIYRLQKGLRLFLFKENNKMVYFLWAEQKNAFIHEFGLPLHIPQDMVYIAGAYTPPDYRGKGIASKYKKEVLHYLKNEGVKNLLGVVLPENTVSLRIHKNLGYQEYQIINYRRYWHIKRYDVQQFNSSEHKTFITIFKAPKDIWKTFL